jgi:hypothetical protein
METAALGVLRRYSKIKSKATYKNQAESAQKHKLCRKTAKSNKQKIVIDKQTLSSTIINTKKYRA